MMRGRDVIYIFKAESCIFRLQNCASCHPLFTASNALGTVLSLPTSSVQQIFCFCGTFKFKSVKLIHLLLQVPSLFGYICVFHIKHRHKVQRKIRQSRATIVSCTVIEDSY